MERTCTGPLRHNFHHHTDCVQVPPAQELVTVQSFIWEVYFQCDVLHGLVNHSVDKDASLEWKISAGMYGVLCTFSKIPAQFCTLTPLGWGESMKIMI